MAGKNDAINYLVDSVDGLTKNQAAEAYDAIFDYLTDVLADGERAQVPGFGSFQISERAAREGRNPKTGEKIKIGASKSVRFKPSKGLKDAVNE